MLTCLRSHAVDENSILFDPVAQADYRIYAAALQIYAAAALMEALFTIYV